MFEIETSEADRIIAVKMTGVFDMAIARACAAAKEAAVDSLGPPFEAHSTLIDIREFRIQAQEIFAVFTDFVMFTKHKSKRLAILGGEGSARMQFRRVAEREALRKDMRYFTEPREAQAWLREGA